MKRKILNISLICTCFGLIGSATTFFGSKAKEVSAAAEIAETINFLDLYNSLQTPVSDYGKDFVKGTSYNIGSGECGTFKVDYGDASNLPNVRYKDGVSQLRLKYTKNYNDSNPLGYLGNYIELNAKEGFAITEISWPSLYYSAGCGYEVQVYDSTKSAYCYSSHGYINSSSDAGAKTISFSPTSSVRLYHKYNTSGQRSFFGIRTSMSVSFVSTAEAYTLSFDSNGGSTVASQICLPGTATTEPIAPTKENGEFLSYTFGGWFDNKECTSGHEFVFGNELTSDLTVYAKWNETPLEESYVATDFVKDIDDSQVLGDTAKSGYKYFNGAYDGTSVLKFYTPNGSKGETFKMVPYKNTGEYIYLRKYPSVSDTSNTHAYMKYASSSSTIGSEFRITPVNPTECDQQITSITVTDLGISEKTAYDNELCIMTSHNGVDWTDHHGLSFDSSTHKYTLECPLNTQYLRVYICRPDSHNLVYLRGISLTYEHITETVSLSFDSNGGTPVEEQIFVKGSGDVTVRPTNPTREGEGTTVYEFDDWYLSKTFDEKFTFGTAIDSDTTIYAKWIESTTSTFTMHFETYGYFEQEDIVANVGEPFIKPANPVIENDVRYDYAFSGWFTGSDLKTEYNWDLGSSENVTVYAKVVASVHKPEGSTDNNVKNSLHHSGNTGWGDTADFDEINSRSFSSYDTFDSSKKNPELLVSISKKTDDSFSGMKRNNYEFECNNTTMTVEVNSARKILKSLRFEMTAQDYYEPRAKQINLVVDGVTVDAQKSPYDSNAVVLYSEFEASEQVKSFDVVIPDINGKNGKGVAIRSIVIEYVDMTVAETAEYYAAKVNELKVCGNSDISGLDSGAWADSKEIYDFLDADTKTYIKNYEYAYDGSEMDSAMIRYDTAVSKHDDIDFIGRIDAGKVSPVNYRVNFHVVDDQSFTSVILIVSFTSIGVLAIALLIKRKQSNNEF